MTLRSLQGRLRSANKVDLVSGTLLAFAAVYVLLETRLYPASVTPGAPGPAAFPRLLAVLLLALAGALVVNSLKAVDWVPPKVQRSALARNLATLLLMVTFVLVAEATDFFVSMLLLVTCVMLILGERGRVALLISGAFVVFLYLLFYKTFGVGFPTRF